MATLPAQLVPIEIMPGVQPSTDRTALNTPHYTMSDKIRFWNGVPQKIGGWLNFAFQYGATISGIARALYSLVLNNFLTSVIGTDSYLYALYGQALTNISPILAATNAIANSISTDYATLANNPVTTSSGTGNLAIADTNAAKYQAGDTYTLAGAATTNGIADTLINAAHLVRSLGTNVVNIIVSGTASSSGAGGGASVVRKTGRLTFAATAHGQSNGDRVKIAGAATTGGVTNTLINKEFIIRNKVTDAFDVMTTGTATSAVTAGGGASTTYQKQLVGAQITPGGGLGYGLGLYGAGLYGVSKTSAGGVTAANNWFFDRFGDRLVATPGNQSGIYLWDGSIVTAPALLSGAPTDINYLFVSDSILVTFGHDDINNKIFASDQGDATNWTASSTNQVYEDIIEGAGELMSSVPVLGINLLFTPTQTYRFSYIGLPNIWEIKLLDNSVGILAPMARCSVNNVAYWMSHNNFYKWGGGNVEKIPANTQDECTFLKYVFGDINLAQVSKSFAWYNKTFDEVWFHYPSAASDECDRIARVSIGDNTWSPDTMDRTCAEYPDNLFFNPRLIDSDGEFFVHETGSDDNTDPLPFTLTSNLRPGGRDTVVLSGFIPDSLQVGDINVNLKGYLWPQSADTTFDKDYTVSDSGPRADIQIGGRYWKYEWSGEELGQSWVMGSWSELVQKGAPN